ncbi:MAG: hypothetical protein KAH96_06530, partial [Alphaproteobacteria bacterium]|nr:hypothetical protein [Alphaproteobacteria bacterium]
MNQVIDTKTPDIIGSIPDINGTIGAALTLEDQRESSRLIEEQAELAFDMIQGEKVTRLNADIEDMQSTVQRSKQAIDEQEKILFATSPTIKAVNIRNERTENKTPLQFLIHIKDFVIGLGCLCLGLIVILMGATNVYSIIMASGTPVFLDEPRLAMMLSGLLPIGSIAFKFFSSTLSNDRVKKYYTISLYGASAAALLVWVILFGITFGSVASGFDWDNLGTDSNMNIDTAFTVVQLLAEMLVGATLFQVAGDIWTTYATTTMVPNPAYEERKKNLKLLRADHGQRTQDFTQNRASLDALKAARKAYINTQILHYKHQATQLYGKHGTSSNTHKKEKNIMKKLFTIALCLILLGLSADAQAKNLIIGLSPVLSKKDTQKQNMQVLRYLSENLEAGQEVLLFDAENRRYLGTFKKPLNKNYANIKALLQYNRSLVSVLRAMNQTDHPALSKDTKGSVKIPQFLTFLAQNYAPLEDTDIVILGSPIYVDLQTPIWDMRGGRYPGDGHFGMQFNQSIFSTSGKENYLKGARIHIGF